MVLPRPFVGRTRELSLLDSFNSKPLGKFLIVYGRRRVGKTRLLTHWADTRGNRLLYWVAKQTSAAKLLASFSQALYEFEQGETPPPSPLPVPERGNNEQGNEGFRSAEHGPIYPSWEATFERIAVLASEKPFVVIIDEFTYALEAVPELASVLQNSWDHRLKNTNLFLIVSGSQVHMMQEQTHSARAPLYGRATGRLHLYPLPYGALHTFFPTYEPDALVALYAILGGMPAYLEMFDPNLSLSDNIRNTLLTPSSLLQADAMLFLHEQFDEPRNYAAIMEAVAHNNRTRKEIAAYTELPTDSVGRYLNTLVELGILERRLPVTAKPTSDSRRGRYVLADAYLRFYFRFIAPRLDQIERYRTSQALEYVKEHLRAFVGEHTFEELCRDWVGLVGDQGRLPISPERIGGYWGSDAQIDVMALNEGKKIALLGECKWGATSIEADTLDKLVRQAPKAMSHLHTPERWKSHLYLFTRTAISEALQKRAQELHIRAVSLAEMDRDLRQDV